MKSILNFVNICLMMFILLVSSLFYGCSKENDEQVLPSKGAMTSVVKAVADNVPYIQEVLDEKIYNIQDGVRAIDVTLTYCRKETHLYITEIDLSKNVTIITSIPSSGSTQTVTEQIQANTSMDIDVLLGINGYPDGVSYQYGTELSASYTRDSDKVFYLLNDGKAYISTVGEFNLHKDKVVNAIGGSHSLLIDGEVTDFIVSDNTMTFLPRTFVGVTKDHMKVYFFVVDGGMDGNSGMRLEDIMLVCQGAGCYQAINLEGKEASAIVYKVDVNNYNLMNKPSGGVEKAVSNGLQVIVKNN